MATGKGQEGPGTRQARLAWRLCAFTGNVHLAPSRDEEDLQPTDAKGTGDGGRRQFRPRRCGQSGVSVPEGLGNPPPPDS